jgi:hypothetical protein
MCRIIAHGLGGSQKTELQHYLEERGKDDFALVTDESHCVGLGGKATSQIYIWGADDASTNAELVLICAMVGNTDYDMANKRGYIPQLPRCATLMLADSKYVVTMDRSGQLEVQWGLHILQNPHRWKDTTRIYIAVDRGRDVETQGISCSFDRDLLENVGGKIFTATMASSLGEYASPILRLLTG